MSDGAQATPASRKIVSSDTKRPQRKHSIRRWLIDHFEQHPHAALTTSDVIVQMRGIDSGADITKAHRVATLRAMKAVRADRVSLRLLRCSGQHAESAIYNSHSVQSYALARLKTDWRHHHWKWTLSVDEVLVKSLEDPESGALMAPGGEWWQFVQEHIAQDSGDVS